MKELEKPIEDLSKTINLLEHNSPEILDEYNTKSEDVLSSALESIGVKKWIGPKNPKSIIFLISGPTCVGKDVVLDAAFSSTTRNGMHCELLKKYTTRKMRNSDLDYYEFISEKKFDKMEQTGEIVMSYVKYGKKYGFDRNHILSSRDGNISIFAVYTEIWHNQFLEMLNSLEELGIAACSILLTADRKYIERRASHRNLHTNETNERIRRATAECDFVEKNPDIVKKQFCYVLDNGDDTAIDDTIDQIEKIIWTTMSLFKSSRKTQ